MSAPALAAPGGRALHIRGTAYPLLLPTIRDPRLHLAAVIFSLHALGQVAFDFRVSIAQILIALGTCAVLESSIEFARRRVIMWPASALITGNGVAFILRLPGTRHGDWWSLQGWYFYAGTAAVALLSKHLIRLSGRHIFNPSNFGLVLTFLIFREGRAEPLDFWWGPMDAWMIATLAIIVGGGLAILYHLRLLPIAIAFWLTFAAGIGVIAATGHAMTARWHVGPVTGFFFWWVLVTSPEILVFLFFMISDPKTIPANQRMRIAYAVAVGVLATLLIAPARTEFWSKVAVLGALLVVCAAWPLLKRYAPAFTLTRTRLAVAAAAAVALYGGGLVAAGIPARDSGGVAPLAHTGRLPVVAIGKSKGVASVLDRKTARRIAADLVADLQLQARALASRDSNALERGATFDRLPELQQVIRQARGRPIVVPSYELDRMDVHYEAGNGQGPAIAVAALTGTQQLTTYGMTRPPKVIHRDAAVAYSETLELQGDSGRWLVARVRRPVAQAAASPAQLRAAIAGFAGVRLTDVAKQVGLDFRQGAFRYGVTRDPPAYMGGGVCWLDYNGDGWLDLFAVNSYGEGDIGGYGDHLPRSVLYRNDHGKRFTKVYEAPPTRGEGCVAADLNGDGRTDLYVTSAQSDQLLWNDGGGRFTEGARAAGVVSFGWHSGAAVADVNGDGRPDLFVAGYTEAHGAIPDSSAGYPTNHLGVRDELFLNLGNGPDGHARFREVGQQVGLDPQPYDHSLGAVFTDANGDGRLDLYVANDEDPNRFYLNVPATRPRLEASPAKPAKLGRKTATPPASLGFRFVERASVLGLADPNAGMGIAADDYSGDGRTDFFVSNSRGQTHAVYRSRSGGFVDARTAFAAAFGTNLTGWGDAWIDLNNDGHLDLALANGEIPVKNLEKDARPLQVLERVPSGFVDASSLVGADKLPLVNGRGLAAADFDNDGHVDLAVNSVGGQLMLLRSTGGTGNWLEVRLPRFAPGAIVTAQLADGRRLVREVHAGSSYLSSEDPRVHFGLGSAPKVLRLIVRYPGGRKTVLGTTGDRIGIAANRIVTAL
jgi:Na+-transporting NADH:ubiquinone oxidoreductase subunit NqrB